ncbi:MAG TPA: glycine oxidase ThiO [Gemmatimonadales bacterium]|nr:glycine oxidase ThiO [Gemmatimonadales bacterium]
MPVNPDVIVIGGGAVGAACARELALTGRRVLLVERTRAGEAWRAAAGMLAPQIETDPEEPLFDLGLAGRERYIMLAAELLDRVGLDIGLWHSGIANLAVDERRANELRTRVALQRQHGHLCVWLDRDEVRAQWPWLGPAHGALWAPREAALDPVRLVEALLADARKSGTSVVQDDVVAVESDGSGRLTGVRGAQGRWSAADVVIAAGAWAGQIDGLPRPISVEPVRGQMAALPWPADVPPAVLYNRDCYMVHREGEAIVGSTMEYAGFRPDVTPDGLAHIKAAVSALYPPLAHVPFTRTWAGLRPVSPDGLPIIGPEPRMPGLWYATGHGRNGILLAGITGVMLREAMEKEPPREEFEAVRPDRFWRW